MVLQVILLLTQDPFLYDVCILFELKPTVMWFIFQLTQDTVHSVCILFELKPAVVQYVILLLTQDTVHYDVCVLFFPKPIIMWSSWLYFG